jgi:hypothetical protein
MRVRGHEIVAVFGGVVSMQVCRGGLLVFRRSRRRGWSGVPFLVSTMGEGWL